MKHLSRLMALLLALMLVATACGNDDEDVAVDDDTTPTTADEGEFPDLSGQSIEVAAIWQGAEQERFQMVIDRFEEETGATISYTPAGDNMDVFLGGRIAGEGPPDVAIVGQPALMRKLAAQGDLVSIEQEAGDEVDEFYDAGSREAGSFQDTLYGVVFKISNKSLLWHNTPVLDDAGVTPPADWDGFVSASQAIADSGVTPVSVGGGDGWTLTDWFENVYLRVGGPESYDALANGELEWTDQTVIDSLTRLSEIWTNDFVVGGLTGATQIGFDESITNTWTNPAGFLYEGEFVATNIVAEDIATIGEDADFVPFPEIDGAGGVIIGGDTAVLLQDSEAGQAFMAYLATPTAHEIWAAEGGFLSANTGVDSSVYPDDVTREAADLLTNAEVTRFDLSDLVPPEFGATTGQGMWKIFQDFLADPSNPEATAQALQAAAG